VTVLLSAVTCAAGLWHWLGRCQYASSTHTHYTPGLAVIPFFLILHWFLKHTHTNQVSLGRLLVSSSIGPVVANEDSGIPDSCPACLSIYL